METVLLLNSIIGTIFAVCYAYQFFYLAVPLFRKDRPHSPEKPNRFCVLICARNEANVIANLLESIRRQDYPAERITAAVIADNCTDDTAAVARAHGAVVYERTNTEQIGKGYAMQELLGHLREDHLADAFDEYLVVDADNVLEPGFVTAINRTLSDGYEAVTTYRNSKNFGDNWVSGGSAFTYLRESQLLNRSRYLLGLGCVVNGTGFAFSRALMERQGGWPFHLLTEDMEFSTRCACDGVKIGYCREAMLFDEQPVSFRQSWRQRMRWSKGYFQVLRRYGGKLLRGAFSGKFICFDILLSILPAFVLTSLVLLINLSAALALLLTGQSPLPALASLVSAVAGFLGTLLVLGVVMTVCEWKKIRATAAQKIGYCLLYPIFMATYVPVAFQALFCRVEWKPIVHTRSMTIDELTDQQKP